MVLERVRSGKLLQRRTREDVAERLFDEIRTYENFILASVKGDYGEELYSFFQYAILLDVPLNLLTVAVEGRRLYSPSMSFWKTSLACAKRKCSTFPCEPLKFCTCTVLAVLDNCGIQ